MPSRLAESYNASCQPPAKQLPVVAISAVQHIVLDTSRSSSLCNVCVSVCLDRLLRTARSWSGSRILNTHQGRPRHQRFASPQHTSTMASSGLVHSLLILLAMWILHKWEQSRTRYQQPGRLQWHARRHHADMPHTITDED